MGSRKHIGVAGVALAISVLLLAACGGGGNGADSNVVVGNDTTTTTAASTASHDHSGHVHAAPVTTKELPVLSDGTLDPNGVDLSGVPGVTADQQKRAEDLLVSSIKTLPKWNDVNTAIADGFKSIGDGITGEEHFLHWDWIDDDTLFDPSHPESLVYKVNSDGTKTLEAAMFILPKEYTLDSVPNIGGALMQFHVHDNLCFTQGVAPHVAGLTSVGGACNPPLQKFNPNAMVHVWIRPNVCGPFAALLGVGAGQTKAGTTRACDHVHGALTL